MSLAGWNVLVFASCASGMSVARLLTDAGARVVLHCNGQEGDATGYGTIEVLNDPADTVEQVEALANKCWESFGPLAGLIVIPQEASPGNSSDSDDDWQDSLRAALKLPFFLTRAVAARMEEAGGGCIVNVVGSEWCGTDQPLAINEVTRSASITMTLALAKALPAKVRVCAVVMPPNAPGTVSDLDSGVAGTILFLLGTESLGTGAIVRLGAGRS